MYKKIYGPIADTIRSPVTSRDALLDSIEFKIAYGADYWYEGDSLSNDSNDWIRRLHGDELNIVGNYAVGGRKIGAMLTDWPAHLAANPTVRNMGVFAGMNTQALTQTAEVWLSNIDSIIDLTLDADPSNKLDIWASYARLDLSTERRQWVRDVREGLMSRRSSNVYIYDIYDLFMVEPLENVATFGVSDYGWVQESSTFSAWGIPIGTKDRFDKVELAVREWDATNPITNIRIRIRENDYAGTVLATKVQALDHGQDLQTFDIDLVDTTEALWLEFLCDGRAGRQSGSASSNPDQSQASSRYATHKNTDGTVSSSTSNKRFYYRLESSLDTQFDINYDNGDGIHLNSDGHILAATTFAANHIL